MRETAGGGTSGAGGTADWQAVLEGVESSSRALQEAGVADLERLRLKMEARGEALLALSRQLQHGAGPYPDGLKERLEACRAAGAEFAHRMRFLRARLVAELNRSRQAKRLARALATGVNGTPSRPGCRG